MDATGMVSVRIGNDLDLDGEELARATQRLRAALLALAVLKVEAVEEEALDGAKGAGEIPGWLWVTIGAEAVTTVVDRVIDWAASSGRAVEITVGDKSLKVGRVSRAEQRELTDAFKARLAPG